MKREEPEIPKKEVKRPAKMAPDDPLGFDVTTEDVAAMIERGHSVVTEER